MERNLSANFKKVWNGYYERIEPKGCSRGIPDVLLSAKEVAFFVELKHEKEKFVNKKLEIRESQKTWFLKFPGIAFFLFQVEDKYYLFEKKHTTFLTQPKVEWEAFVDNSIIVTNDLEMVKRKIQTIVCMKVATVTAIMF